VPIEPERAPELPAWAVALITQSVGQLRERIQQRLAHERLQQREFELSALVTLIRSLNSARTPREALGQLMIAIRDLFGVEAGTLFRLDRQANQLIFEVLFGSHQEELYQRRLPVGRGIAGWVVAHGEPLLISDVKRDPRFEHAFDQQTGFQTRSILCVPLIAMGEVRGVLQLLNKLDGSFTERDLLLLRITAGLGALVQLLDQLSAEHQLGA
jgi:GAF domain-containing protein